MKNLILFLLLVVPGSAVVLASAWWSVNDFTALQSANQREQELIIQGASQRELIIIARQESTHRLNFSFDGTWMLIGGILAGIGIQEMRQVDK